MAKNVFWLILGSAIGGTINFFVIIYLARVLGASAFGLFVFAQAFLIYFVLLVDSGLSLFGVREIAKSPDSAGSITLNLFVLRLLLAAVLFFFSLSILMFIPVAESVRWLFAATFLFVFYRALNADWVFQGLEKMEFNAFSKIIYASLCLPLIILFVKNANDLARAPLIQALCGIAAAVIFLFILGKFILRFQFTLLAPAKWWSYFLAAMPLGASIVLIQVYNNFDTIMLGFMDKPAVVGYYNAAYRVFNVLVSGFALWQSTALPIMSKRFGDNLDRAKEFINKYLHLTMLFIIPLTLAVFLSAPLLIKLLFGAEYAQGVLALQILAWNLILVSIGSVYGVTILIPSGHYNRFFIAVAIGAIVNIVLNFILIPPFSFVGAAIATLLAELFSVSVSFFYARQIIRLPLVRYLFKPVLVSLAGMLVFILIFKNILTGDYLASYVLALAGYAAACAGIVLVIEKDFVAEFVLEIFRSKNA